MAKWIFKENYESVEVDDLNIHPVVAKILSSRGILKKDEIEKFILPNYERDTYDPFLFVDMEKAVARIEKAALEKEKVAIFGDYDADGVTSSAILKETFDSLGIDSIVYIPNKHNEGYGMNSKAVELLKEKGVSLIVTVDCGITSIKEVDKASTLAIDVIITDHHHVPEEIPKAFAIINPQMKNSGYPFANLAGVGVAFKFSQGIYKKLMPEKFEQTKWMLDLVAIGTIADCVPLIDENRLFAKYGLIVLSKTKRLGLKEIFAVGRIDINEGNIPDTKKVSFYIAPRINAAGRVNHADLAYKLISATNVLQAREFALELEQNNSDRQKMTETITNEVKLLAKSMFKDKKFIFAFGEHFPIGIVGLVAGKIAQQENKPTAIFQKGEGESKGSFRSIPQINIIETIEKCKDLLIKFGGHSQAAGVSIKNDKVDVFFQKMDYLIEQQLQGVDLVEEVLIDFELSSEEIGFPLTDSLKRMEPYGEGNKEPIFLIKGMRIVEKRLVGSTAKHVKFTLAPVDSGPKLFDSISFNGAEKFSFLKVDDIVELVCTIKDDEWNGNKKVQLSLIDARVIV
jgi:single-stranded-DNA-specific exonuclease